MHPSDDTERPERSHDHLQNDLQMQNALRSGRLDNDRLDPERGSSSIFTPKRRQWILWLIVGFGAMLGLGGLSTGCSHSSPQKVSPSNGNIGVPRPVDDGVGSSSSSPGRTPYGENSGTQSYPIGRAKQALAPKTNPQPSPGPGFVETP